MTNTYKTVLSAVILFTFVFAVYGRAVHYDFINFDDGAYVIDNIVIHSGLTLKNVLWSFSLESSRKTGCYYHPITWLSHMADIEIFGLQPGMHHLMNILLHSMNAFLLFSVLWWMTRAFWQSLLVASLFALHPMNVDTVAWIAERKNILSLFFCLTTLLAYTYYTRKPGFSRYMLVMLTFLCALMSKPMVVTLPILLLMLDYWPLKRFQNLRNEEGGALLSKRRFKKSVLLLVAEKMPLIFLSILSTGMTLSSLTFYQDIIPLETRPLGARISHSLIAYVIYLLKTFVPVNLAIHHHILSMSLSGRKPVQCSSWRELHCFRSSK